MQRTARGATPLHTAAATGNFEVVEVLLRFPGVDVNAKNKDNKTPYDVASSNRKMQNMIARSGGLAASNQTGFGSRDEANARQRGGPASEARMRRAAEWRSRR